MQDNNNQLKTRLTQVHTALDSPVLNTNSAEDGGWRVEFAQLITLVHSLLSQAEQAGKRVDFLEGVGVNGKVQDITSLVDWMYTHLTDLTTDKPGQLSTNRLNRYAEQGWGYFANGSFFTAEFDNEMAFFIDDQRIYLNRHLRRAISTVEQTFSTRL